MDDCLLHFSLKLYQQIRLQDDQNENILCSPGIIGSSIAMVLAGARENTAKEIVALFGLNASAERVCDCFSKFLSNLAAYSPGVIIQAVNGLYSDQTFPVKAGYQSLLDNSFGTTMRSVDFKNKHEAVRGEVNSSVLERTSSKIQELLPSASVKKETALIVLNAIYIKGYWQHPFQWRYTRAQEFHVDCKHSVLVDMLFQDRGYRVGCSEVLRARALEIPYRGHRASVVILLPNGIEGLSYLQDTLTTTSLCAILSSLRMVMNIELSLPKFKLEERLFLKDTLKTLGVKDLFTPGDADLSGIFETGRPAVSEVVHKAFFKIDEGGTDAASATAMTSLACSATMPLHVTRFVVDHPFMFILKSNEPDMILFMGSVKRP